MNLASNHDYKHSALIIKIYMVQPGAVAPIWTWGPLIFISKFISSYNRNNQLAKFEKNLSVGSISVEWP